MAASLDPSVRDAVLKDPKVQEAVRKVGQDALNDPDVQRQILETLQEKFPQAASAAKDKILEWANDPEVQRQAYAVAGVAADYAWQSVSQVTALIEQGPTGVRVLAFAGGVAAFVKSFIVLLGLLNPVDVAVHLPYYVVMGYEGIFAISTMLFEAKPEWIEQISGLNAYQSMLLDKAKFLAETGGRGLFYGFQGTLWLCFASFTNLLELGLGLWFLFMAFLHISMHFGVMPHEVASKMRNVREMVGLSKADVEKGAAEDAKPNIQQDAPKAVQPSAQGGATPKPEIIEEKPHAEPDKEPLLKAEDKSAPASSLAESGQAGAGRQDIKPAGKGGCCTVQ
eukprot:gb/GFBE01017101.1/.p1 GENE.gb/GFBE01017101.1/~~gb/GFBE01017101.1/.p1  ORF type:complete len:338 (+),score=99.74 gb/GFBE01017101.1/:1-1014(+)